MNAKLTDNCQDCVEVEYVWQGPFLGQSLQGLGIEKYFLEMQDEKKTLQRSSQSNPHCELIMKESVSTVTSPRNTPGHRKFTSPRAIIIGKYLTHPPPARTWNTCNVHK